MNTPSADDTRVIPVIEETLDVQKRRVDTGGVRLTLSEQAATISAKEWKDG